MIVCQSGGHWDTISMASSGRCAGWSYGDYYSSPECPYVKIDRGTWQTLINMVNTGNSWTDEHLTEFANLLEKMFGEP